MIIKLNHQPSGGKEWVAEITGRDPKYKFKREFCNLFIATGVVAVKQEQQALNWKQGKIYEINEPWKDRRFIEIKNGQIRTINTEEVLSKFY